MKGNPLSEVPLKINPKLNSYGSHDSTINRNNNLHSEIDNNNNTIDNDDESSVLEDVLPSFEMHNYMFNRTIYDTENIALLSQPPTYDGITLDNKGPKVIPITNQFANPPLHADLDSDMQTICHTYTHTHTLNGEVEEEVAINNNNNNNSNNNNDDDDDLLGPPPPLTTDPNNFVDPTKNPNLLLLNNLEKFQRIELPIHIQVVLTKNIPKLNVKSERENPLRQYRPGDIVCGYVLIQNKSNEPIPFEMQLLSLEGELLVPHPTNPDEIIKKKFLKTYDLSACFHYGCIDLQGVSFDKTKDDVDNTQIGFGNDRTIMPNIVHKKMFAFKLPNYLLDTSCFDQLPNHLKLPPSFGVDRTAFNGYGKSIKVNPLLGYGRLDRYGSPIRSMDFANEGQAISYSIKCQFIGRNLDFYKKFYTHETKHNFDFIILKSVDYFFRIETSNCFDEQLIDNPHGEVSTAKQIQIIEKMVTDKLNEILERTNLKHIGIEDPRKQDEIIFSSLPSSKKSTPLNSSELTPTLTDTKTSITDDTGFTRLKNISFVKDFFNKVEGDLSISLSMHKNAQIKSLKPKQFTSRKRTSSLSSLTVSPVSSNSASATSLANLNTSFSNTSLSNLHSNSTLTPVTSQLRSNNESFTSLNSLNLKPVSSDKSLESYTEQNIHNENIYIHLEFKPPNSISSKRNSSKVNLPNLITISPNLKIFNIQSPYPIPITFDNKFIFNGGLDNFNLSNMRKKFSFYYHQLVEVLKELEAGLARSIYNKVNGLSRLYTTEQIIKKVFETQTIDLHNQWKFNSNSNIYECDFQIPLHFDLKNIDKLSAMCLVPTFQQCHLSRLYAVDIEVSVKKSKQRVNMCFPLSVV
ncbi:ubiquitin-ubiquitin ligase [Pichia kluyveri]|uniref:Ubiquitin-ubiquitin ligase n=1 Tax=Pichia kluyveri TaxID=36015 RepID=A0AAV5R9J9_PICKL|nr:ubiquitin-ubiquitin ligase [Pichia kluyveri]